MTLIDSILMAGLMACIAEVYCQYRLNKISSKIMDIVESEIDEVVEDSYVNLLNILVQEKVIEIDEAGIITGINGKKSDWVKMQKNLEIYDV